MTAKPSNTENELNPSTREEESSTISSSEETTIETPEETITDSVIRIELPEPDTDNITVLSHKLPNKPILPWNHYDSPWEGSENSDPGTSPDTPSETAVSEEKALEK